MLCQGQSWNVKGPRSKEKGKRIIISPVSKQINNQNSSFINRNSRLKGDWLSPSLKFIMSESLPDYFGCLT